MRSRKVSSPLHLEQALGLLESHARSQAAVELDADALGNQVFPGRCRGIRDVRPVRHLVRRTDVRFGDHAGMVGNESFVTAGKCLDGCGGDARGLHLFFKRSERTHCRGLYKMTGELSSIMRVPRMQFRKFPFLPGMTGCGKEKKEKKEKPGRGSAKTSFSRISGASVAALHGKETFLSWKSGCGKCHFTAMTRMRR